MALVAVIALDRIQLTADECLTGYEGFVLVWGKDALRVYKSIV